MLRPRAYDCLYSWLVRLLHEPCEGHDSCTVDQQQFSVFWTGLQKSSTRNHSWGHRRQVGRGLTPKLGADFFPPDSLFRYPDVFSAPASLEVRVLIAPVTMVTPLSWLDVEKGVTICNSSFFIFTILNNKLLYVRVCVSVYTCVLVTYKRQTLCSPHFYTQQGLLGKLLTLAEVTSHNFIGLLRRLTILLLLYKDTYIFAPEWTELSTSNFSYIQVSFFFFFFAAPSVHAHSGLHDLEQDTHNVEADVLPVRSLSNKNE